MFKLDLEKSEEPRPNCHYPWITEKARQFQENIYFYFIDYVKAYAWIRTSCGIFFKR